MTTFPLMATYLVQTLGSFYLTIVMLRFLLQLVKADFYNPISVFIVNATQIPSGAIRKFLPPFRSFDLASLVLALLVQWLIIQLTLTINDLGVVSIFMALSWGLVGALKITLNIYLYGLLAIIIVSWVAPQSQHPAIVLIQQIVSPAMRPFKRILPSFGALDLSPMLLFLVLNVLEFFIHGLAGNLLLPTGRVAGI
ncbi:MAG: YggT family protein [Saprospiraceae bacterium]|jgi:YggT family protein